MAQLFANNAITLLASPLGTMDATLNVAAGTGSLFPEITNPADFFLVTIENQLGTVREIIGIGGRTGDELEIISRGLEGTTPVEWSVNSTVEIRMTAGTLNAHTSAMSVINNTMATGFSLTTDTNQKLDEVATLLIQLLNTQPIKNNGTGAVFIDFSRSAAGVSSAPLYTIDGGVQAQPHGTIATISNAHVPIYQSQAGISLLYSAITFS